MEKLILLLKNEYSLNISNTKDLEINFRQLELDSLQVIALISATEELYKIQFSIEELEEIENLKDLFECVAAKRLCEG